MTTALPIATVAGKMLTAAGSSGELASGDMTLKSGETPIPIFTIADHPFTANPTGFSIFDATLLPGSPGITIAGIPTYLSRLPVSWS